MAGKEWGVVTASSVQSLASAVLDPARQRPIIVVTTVKYTSPDAIPQETLDEAEALRNAVGDIADIAIVASGDISFSFADALPDGWHVFGGYSRSYPAGISADPDTSRSPLRRLSDKGASELVISDALGHANAAGLLNKKPKGSVSKNGTVEGFLFDGGQALIGIGATFPAIAWRDMTSPGIPLDWLIAKGATVSGEHDRDHNRFVLRRRTFNEKSFLDAYSHNAVTLALVDKVNPERAVLRVTPDVKVVIRQPDLSPNPHDSLDLWLFEGQVVPVRVIHLSTGKLHLRLSDIDDDEPIEPAVTVVEGGTPWLLEGRSLPTAEPERSIETDAGASTAAEPEPEPDHEPSVVEVAEPVVAAPPRPLPGPGMRPAVPSAPPADDVPITTTPIEVVAGDGNPTINSMSLKITALNSEIAKLKAELTKIEPLNQELRITKLELNSTRRELGQERARRIDFQERQKRAVESNREADKARKNSAAKEDRPRDRRNNWPDDESWIRNEIHRAWVERVAASDKSEFPLPADYLLGPRFAESITALDDGQFGKAMKCVVDVLIDRAKDLPSRDIHRLRTGMSGDDPPRVRADDGANAWRAAVEINVASARRLHYWTIGTQIELAKVAVHDDMEM